MRLQRRRSPAGPLRALAAGLAVIAVTGLVVLFRGRLPLGTDQVQPSPPTAAPTFSAEQPAVPTPTAVPVAERPAAPGTFDLLPQGAAPAPAAEWAAGIVEAAQAAAEAAPAPLGGLAWWQNSGSPLHFAGGELLIGSQPLHLEDFSQVAFFAPDPALEGRLMPLGEAAIQGTALALSRPGGQQWLLSAASPQIAVEALAFEAENRRMELRLAYDLSGPAAQIILVGFDPLQSLGAPAAASPTPTPGPSPTASPSPMPTLTPSPTPTATPTRPPDDFLGRLMAEKTDAVLALVPGFPRGTIYDTLNNHPRSGPLTWTETGAAIDGQPTALREAQTLTFYRLPAGPDEQGTQRLFEVIYEDGATRLPEEQVFFQGQRMEELLYWMVRRAAEQGGQLLVAYDDFGTRQAVTIIGFTLFTAAPAP